MNYREFVRWLTLVVAAAGVCGCGTGATKREPAAAITTSAVRAQRRLYDGAPPVVPHPPLNIACIACHTDAGKEAPPLGFAPASPHLHTKGVSGTGFCQQCHVFRREDTLFAQSDFHGLKQQLVKADRLYRGAPPVIPHRIFMRENCTSCHSGPAARPEIRCTHPHRENCRQCHVPGIQSAPAPALATL